MFVMDAEYTQGSIAKEILKSCPGFSLRLVNGGKHATTIEELVEAAFKVEETYLKRQKINLKAASEEHEKERVARETKRAADEEIQIQKNKEARRVREAEEYTEWVRSHPVRVLDTRDGDMPFVTINFTKRDGARVTGKVIVSRGTMCRDAIWALYQTVRWTWDPAVDRAKRLRPGETAFSSITGEAVLQPYDIVEVTSTAPADVSGVPQKKGKKGKTRGK